MPGKRTKAKSFTLVIDSIVQKYDLLTAAVFGRVWRYCQMEDGVCRAAQETIGRELKLSYKTVDRRLRQLVRAKYIKDLTPGLRNRPHIYALTSKGKSCVPKKASTPSENGRTESPSRSDSVSEQVGQRVQAGRTESPMKKVFKKGFKTAAEETGAPAQPAPVEHEPESAAAVSSLFDENRQALRDARVEEPNRSRIAAKEHVNPSYIKAHDEAFQREEAEAERRGKEVPPVGRLVMRLLAGDPVPVPPRMSGLPTYRAPRPPEPVQSSAPSPAELSAKIADLESQLAGDLDPRVRELYQASLERCQRQLKDLAPAGAAAHGAGP